MDLFFFLFVEDRKFVVMDNFLDVVYLVRILVFLVDYGLNVLFSLFFDLNEKNNFLIFVLIFYIMIWVLCIKC